MEGGGRKGEKRRKEKMMDKGGRWKKGGKGEKKRRWIREEGGRKGEKEGGKVDG